MIHPVQHGFLTNISCPTELLNYIVINLADRKQADLSIMDFTKALEKVSQSLLIRKFYLTMAYGDM